jgi:hypothetical protein
MSSMSRSIFFFFIVSLTFKDVEDVHRGEVATATNVRRAAVCEDGAASTRDEVVHVTRLDRHFALVALDRIPLEFQDNEPFNRLDSSHIGVTDPTNAIIDQHLDVSEASPLPFTFQRHKERSNRKPGGRLNIVGII